MSILMICLLLIRSSSEDGLRENVVLYYKLRLKAFKDSFYVR